MNDINNIEQSVKLKEQLDCFTNGTLCALVWIYNFDLGIRFTGTGCLNSLFVKTVVLKVWSADPYRVSGADSKGPPKNIYQYNKKFIWEFSARIFNIPWTSWVLSQKYENHCVKKYQDT